MEKHVGIATGLGENIWKNDDTKSDIIFEEYSSEN